MGLVYLFLSDEPRGDTTLCTGSEVKFIQKKYKHVALEYFGHQEQHSDAFFLYEVA
jgi:hypothetical protein